MNNSSNEKNDGLTPSQGRASLIRATLDHGFRSRVCNDAVGRLKTVEKEHAEAKK